MPRKTTECEYNQLALTDASSEHQEHSSYMAEVVSVPEYKRDKKRWHCMVKLLPDLWEQTRDALCFVQAQKQSALEANKFALFPGDVIKIGGVLTGKQIMSLQSGNAVTIERFSLSNISVFSRAPRLQPQTIANGTRRLLA